MKILDNKKVIVTGGCRGIGKEIVKKYLMEGAAVATTYCESQKSAAQLRKELIEYENHLFIYKMDVTDEKQVNTIMNQMQQQLEGIDILVNNAGIIKDNLLYSMKPDDWDKVIKTNLYGSFYTCKSVLFNMIKQKSGSIINMASVSGIIGIAGQSNYCASKFGLIGLTKSLAKEVAPKKIRVNAIAPGYIDTDMVNSNKVSEELKRNKQTMGRMGTAEEIADIALFLASNQSSYMTGQVLVADGGII